ncbi:MAG: hypothetical protein LBC70_04420 [Chitinispirillales bacterium]|nr:hypothetical protein [Chitinispirillales bacterium]
MSTSNTNIPVNPSANREYRDSVFGLLFSQAGVPFVRTELYTCACKANGALRGVPAEGVAETKY